MPGVLTGTRPAEDNGFVGTVARGVVGLGKMLGKGIWLVLKLLAVVLSLGVVAWIRHRRNKKLRDRQSELDQREAALEQRVSAMESQPQPDVAAPTSAPATEPAGSASAARPEAPPATE